MGNLLHERRWLAPLHVADSGYSRGGEIEVIEPSGRYSQKRYNGARRVSF